MFNSTGSSIQCFQEIVLKLNYLLYIVHYTYICLTMV